LFVACKKLAVIRDGEMKEQETIFHKIIRGEIPADVVFEDETVLAFRDVNPVSPIHILVIPKKTLPGLDDATESDKALLGHMLYVVAEIARKEGIAKDGYRTVINCGEDGGQTVFQLHMHLLGGREHGWPPG